MQEESDFKNLVRTWLFRMLKLEFALIRFVGRDKLGDDTIARTLGMQKWIQGESELEAEMQKDEMVDWSIRECQKKLELEGHPAARRPKFEYCRSSALAYVFKKIKEYERQEPKLPEFFQTNCKLFAEIFGLNSLDRELLTFHIVLNEFSALSYMFHTAKPRNGREYIAMLEAALGIPSQQITKALDPKSRLVNQQLLIWGSRDSEYQQPLRFYDNRVGMRIVWESCTSETLIRDIVAPVPGPNLRYSDYPQMKDTFDPIRKHLGNALKNKRKGVNIFIYGRAGTGKTEFPRILARELRADIYQISTENDEGDAIEPDKRLEAYNRATGLLLHRRSILVFDEAEDIFRDASFFRRGLASSRKGWVNRQLESNPIPVIWISNSMAGLEPAFARRFDFVFEMKPLPKSYRLILYRKLTNLRASEKTLLRVADCEELTPAVVKRAASVAESACGSHQDSQYERLFTDLVEKTLDAQGYDASPIRRKHSAIPTHYSLDFLNTDAELQELPKDLKEDPSCTMCLYGPPGTGKTTLGHWLSKKLERPILLKKASDLISPYLGETEIKIAAAFSEATRDQAILMIDEVDSFIQDRSHAVRSWEVTQVNEMLTQIENFDGIFIASTNLMDDIDKAALRRFDLKVKFSYLTNEQIVSLVNKSVRDLGLKPPNNAAREIMQQLINCTPGDFSNVAKQGRFKKFTTTGHFVEALAKECSMKIDSGGKKMGFQL